MENKQKEVHEWVTKKTREGVEYRICEVCDKKEFDIEKVLVMKTYRVTLRQTEDFFIEVEAADEKEAAYIADDKFSHGDYTETGELAVETADVIRICPFCKEAEDDDGRCKCTNKDSK